MALSDKNIVITPNIGSANDDPKIVFSGADASTAAQNITLKTYPIANGTLSFEGSAGQLFSITNSLSGTIFSVNDVSGIPSIEVLDTGNIKLAQYSGNISINSDIFPFSFHAPSSNPTTYVNTASITFGAGIKNTTYGQYQYSGYISHGVLLGGDTTRNTAVIAPADSCTGGIDIYGMGEGPSLALNVQYNAITVLNGLKLDYNGISHTVNTNAINLDTYNGLVYSSGVSLPHIWRNANLGEQMRLTANGDFGIGYSSPSYKVHVNGTVAANSFVGVFYGNANTATTSTNIAGGAAGNVHYQSGAGATAFVTNGTAGQVLTSNGASAPAWTNIGTTITNDITTNSSFYPIFTSTTSGMISAASVSNTKLYYNANTGTLSATIFDSLSDSNFKTNVVTIQNGLEVVKSINPVEFDWVDSGEHNSGVIAQQLELVLPFLVATNEKGDKSVNYSGLIAYLIGAVKELSDKVDELEKK